MYYHSYRQIQTDRAVIRLAADDRQTCDCLYYDHKRPSLIYRCPDEAAAEAAVDFTARPAAPSFNCCYYHMKLDDC